MYVYLCIYDFILWNDIITLHEPMYIVMYIVMKVIITMSFTMSFITTYVHSMMKVSNNSAMTNASTCYVWRDSNPISFYNLYNFSKPMYVCLYSVCPNYLANQY
jgi:hypothetical protein